MNLQWQLWLITHNFVWILLQINFFLFLRISFANFEISVACTFTNTHIIMFLRSFCLGFGVIMLFQISGFTFTSSILLLLGISFTSNFLVNVSLDGDCSQISDTTEVSILFVGSLSCSFEVISWPFHRKKS